MIEFNFIILIAITACWISGFEYTFNTGEIFGKPGDWMRDNLPDWVTKPLFDCPYCMSSIHGTLFFLLFAPIYSAVLWVVFCFSVCGFLVITRK